MERRLFERRRVKERGQTKRKETTVVRYKAKKDNIVGVSKNICCQMNATLAKTKPAGSKAEQSQKKP